MEWMEAAGRVVEAIGTPKFSQILSQALREVTPFNYTVVFGYIGSARPLALYDDFPPNRRRMHVEEYLEGPYLLDPFFLKSLDLSDPGLWRLREIAPDRFYQGEYYRSYYAQTGLAEEIGYLITVNSGLVLVVSLMRKEKRFSNGDVRALKKAWPIVDTCCRKHWQDLTIDDSQNLQSMEDRIEAAFRGIGEGVLTARERQVVELTLRGHSADATGKLLEIASGTVRIHRRNIYTKLRISSQGELFSEFIEAMISPAAAGTSAGP